MYISGFRQAHLSQYQLSAHYRHHQRTQRGKDLLGWSYIQSRATQRFASLRGAWGIAHISFERTIWKRSNTNPAGCSKLELLSDSTERDSPLRGNSLCVQFFYSNCKARKTAVSRPLFAEDPWGRWRFQGHGRWTANRRIWEDKWTGNCLNFHYTESSMHVMILASKHTYGSKDGFLGTSKGPFVSWDYILISHI